MGMFFQIVAGDDHQNIYAGEKKGRCLMSGKLEVQMLLGRLSLVLNPVACRADRNRNCFSSPAI